MGHEFSGEIVEIGDDVEGLELGKKVVIQPFTGMCGRCYYCKIGHFWSCSSRRLIGGMAEYVAVPIENIYPIPDYMDPVEASLLEPFAVTLHALHVSSFKILDTVAILGPGPIGLMMLIALRKAGASLIIITGKKDDVSPRLRLAEQIGADATVNIDEDDPVKKVMDMTRGHGVDIVYDTSGNQNAGPQGIKMLKTKGKLVVIGHYPGTMNLLDPSYKGYSIIGNVSYDWDTWERLIPYLERRRLDFGMLVSHKLPLDETERGFRIARSKKSVKILFIP
jgi:2-desacetyl-2-hydroxyethyl bacteriochlorophyllide A dehydrogenase